FGREPGRVFLLLRVGELGGLLLLGREPRRFFLLLFLGELRGLLLLRLLLGRKPRRLLLLRLLGLCRRLALRLFVDLRLPRALRLDLRDRRRRLHRHRRRLGRAHGEVGRHRADHDHAAEDAGDDHRVAPLRRHGLRRDRDGARRLLATALGNPRLAFGGERLGLHFLLPVAALADLLGRPRLLLGSAFLLQLVVPRARARVGLLPGPFFGFALRLGFFAPCLLVGLALRLRLGLAPGLFFGAPLGLRFSFAPRLVFGLALGFLFRLALRP